MPTEAEDAEEMAAEVEAIKEEAGDIKAQEAEDLVEVIKEEVPEEVIRVEEITAETDPVLREVIIQQEVLRADIQATFRTRTGHMPRHHHPDTMAQGAKDTETDREEVIIAEKAAVEEVLAENTEEAVRVAEKADTSDQEEVLITEVQAAIPQAEEEDTEKARSHLVKI